MVDASAAVKTSSELAVLPKIPLHPMLGEVL